MKKLLINRTDAIGDTLITTALARYLKEHSDFEITLLVSKRSGDLIKFCEGVDHVVILDTKTSKINQLRYLLNHVFNESFHAYAHLGGSFLPSFVALIKGIPLRTGILSKVFSYLYLNKGIRQARSLVHKHEMAYNIEFARVLLNQSISSKENLQNYAPQLALPRDETTKPWDDAYIIVHPGMTGHTLNWPMKNYADLVSRINKNYPELTIVISHTPSDQSYIDKLVRELKALSLEPRHGSKVLFFDGSEKGLIHYSQLIKDALLFIGPSTGTTHIANALRVPQVALYSPIKVQSSKRWGPCYQWDKCVVFEPVSEELSMDTVDVESVEKACHGILAGVKSE